MSRAIISTDPIADMLTRIRNAMLVGKNEVAMPHSKTKETVAKILADSGFLAGISVSGEKLSKELNVKINEEGSPAVITEISRLSSPGRRVYVKSKDIPVVRRGRGIVIVSTSKGMMTGKQAKTAHLGGELICRVY